MGSGVFIRKAIKKYGIENFIKEIISFHSNIDDLYEAERIVVDKDFVSRRDTYNMELGGAGGKIWTPEMISKMKDSINRGFANGRISSMKNKNHTMIARKKMSDNHKEQEGENNPMYRKPCYYRMTEEEKLKWQQSISKGNKGKERNEEHKKKYSEAAKKRIWLVNVSGQITNTQDENDPRLQDENWQRGKKWKYIK